MSEESSSRSRRVDRFSGQESRRRAGRIYRVSILALLILVALLCWLLFSGASRAVYTSRTLDFGLRDIGEFATQMGYYTNVNTITKPDRTIIGVPIPGTSSRAIMTYQGTIRAGLDFAEIRLSVDPLQKKIRLDMPRTRILSNEVDLSSCRIYDEQNSIFNKISVSNVNASLAEMKARAEEQAIENNILEAARVNAETLIRGLFSSAGGAEDYELIFSWEED